MSTSETPRFLIPYPSDDAEEWWQTFRDGMNAIDAVMFRNMEANKLIMRDLPDVVVESDGVGGYQLRFISGDLTFISRTLETYIPVNTATPVPVYANGIIVCPIQAAATTPTAVDLECLLNGVEIDSSLIPIGYVRSDYTVIWYNGAQMLKDTITTMFAGIGGGGGGGGERKPAVIDYVDCTAAPPTEVVGDRYILDASGAVHANWDGAAQNSIVEFTGAIWGSQTPSEGWVAYVDLKDADYRYIDDGAGQWEKIVIVNNAVDVNVDNSGWNWNLTTEANVQTALNTLSARWPIYDDTTTFTDVAASGGESTVELDIGTIDDGIAEAVKLSITAGTSADTMIQLFDGDPALTGDLIYEAQNLDLVTASLDDRTCWYVELPTTGELWVRITNDGSSISSYSLRLRIKGDR